LDTEADQTEGVVSLIGVPASFVISVPKNQSAGLVTSELGEKINFKDSRDRLRTMIVLERISPTTIRVGLDQTIYMKEGIELHGEISGSSFSVGPIKAQPIDLQIKSWRHFANLQDSWDTWSQSHYRKTGGNKLHGTPFLKFFNRFSVDIWPDGKIGAVVRSSSTEHEYLELYITYPMDSAAKIRPEKVLNFPDSNLNLPALTSEDIITLDFVAKHATAVALSFVHRPQDLYDLRDALHKLDHSDIGIVAKIETADAIHYLAQILIAGPELPKFGILNARGDLAIEVGFEIWH